jgi:uroporphyrin-3 C-methyltransferase
VAEVSEAEVIAKEDSSSAHRSRSGFWFGIIILIIVFILAGVGYYLMQQLRARQSDLGGEVKGEMSKKIGDYQSQLTAIQSQLAALESDIAGKDTHFTKTIANYAELHNQKLESTRKELTDAVRQVQRQLGKTRGDWLMADAEYLLSVANERLHLIGDVNTTLAALEAADQRLRESGDAAAFKVREQIAKDMAALRTVVMPDIIGLYASVRTLQDQIDKLELTLPYSGKMPGRTPENASSKADKKANSVLDSAIKEIEGIVTIRRVDQPIKEVLTPEEAAFIREQLRVKLEIIKIALIQHNETLFADGIKDAKQWLLEHFNKNTDFDKAMAGLDKLAGVQIHSQFPDISLSLKMLRDITKLRMESDKEQEAKQPSAGAVNNTMPPASGSNAPDAVSSNPGEKTPANGESPANMPPH